MCEGLPYRGTNIVSTLASLHVIVPPDTDVVQACNIFASELQGADGMQVHGVNIIE